MAICPWGLFANDQCLSILSADYKENGSHTIPRSMGLNEGASTAFGHLVKSIILPFPQTTVIDIWFWPVIVNRDWVSPRVMRVSTHRGRVMHIRQKSRLSLVQIMACHLFGNKPLSDPMLVCVNWTHGDKSEWNMTQSTIISIQEKKI